MYRVGCVKCLRKRASDVSKTGREMYQTHLVGMRDGLSPRLQRIRDGRVEPLSETLRINK